MEILLVVEWTLNMPKTLAWSLAPYKFLIKINLKAKLW